MTEKEILRSLATKYSIPEYVIEMIVKSPFVFLKNRVISPGEFKSMRITNLGIFTVSTRKLAHIQKHVEAKRKLNECKGDNNRDTKLD